MPVGGLSFWACSWAQRRCRQNASWWEQQPDPWTLVLEQWVQKFALARTCHLPLCFDMSEWLRGSRCRKRKLFWQKKSLKWKSVEFTMIMDSWTVDSDCPFVRHVVYAFRIGLSSVCTYSYVQGVPKFLPVVKRALARAAVSRCNSVCLFFSRNQFLTSFA